MFKFFLLLLLVINFNIMASRNRITLSKIDKVDIINVFEANDLLHNAFFNYDGDEIEKAASNLKKKIDKIKNQQISKLLNYSKKKLDLLISKNNRKINNQHYHIFSMALIHIMNSYDVGTKYNAYSCPMVKKKWIQNSNKKKDINNPYASSMPNCGSKDTSY